MFPVVFERGIEYRSRVIFIPASLYLRGRLISGLFKHYLEPCRVQPTGYIVFIEQTIIASLLPGEWDFVA